MLKAPDRHSAREQGAAQFPQLSAALDLREGSSLYYSLLWTEPLQKIRVLNRLALIQAIGATLHDVQEPQVAERKIHWWHEELSRLLHGESRHPAAQACQSELNHSESAQQALLEILSVASEERFKAASTPTEAQQLITRDFSARLALLAHALSNDKRDLEQNTDIAPAALALGTHEKLSKLPSLIHRGMPVFSDETYRQFKLQPTDLSQHIRLSKAVESQNDHESNTIAAGPESALQGIPVVTEKPERAALLHHAVVQCLHDFDIAIASDEIRSRFKSGPYLPIWRLLILRQAQLSLWSKKQPDLLRERMSLTPLSKLYKAWRHRR